jgi:hypothetical protein
MQLTQEQITAIYEANKRRKDWYEFEVRVSIKIGRKYRTTHNKFRAKEQYNYFLPLENEAVSEMLWETYPEEVNKALQPELKVA